MEVEQVDIKSLKPHPKNPRIHPDSALEKLTRSIKEFGWTNPILVSADGYVLAGHARLKAAEKAGITQVPIIRLPLSGARAEAYMIADNKLQDETEWDFPRLADMLKGLDTDALDVTLTGFGRKEIEDLMEQFSAPMEGLIPDDEIPEKVETVCKTGDLWQLGTHRLLCGDATKKEDMERLMGGEKADMVFTDPPYGIDLDTDFSSMVGWFGKGNKYDKVKSDNSQYDPSLVLVTFKNCPEIILWGADYYAERLPQRNLGSWFVWDKTGAGIRTNSSYDKMFGSNFELCWSKNRHKRQVIPILWKGIFGLASEDIRRRVHPTQKPVELCFWFINRFSKLNDIIIDLFGGSGSTLIACEKLGRQCRMMEIVEHYCDVIIARWQTFTGKRASLIDKQG